MASHDPQPNTSKEDSSNDFFEHTPLDTTLNSIRLLRILPDLSNTGLVQCEIWHATTDAEYTCLSYVWGAEANQETIYVNGKRHSCRRNLWDFLSVARTRYASGLKSFWIDAICIDQVEISERNHQVRQMGDIYARATDVIAWLGRDQGAIEFLVFLNFLATQQFEWEKDARRIWYRKSTEALRRSYLDFEANEYWTRAWITQEILQSQKFSILINDTQIREPEFEALLLLLPTLQSTVSRPGRKASDEFFTTADRCFEIYVRVMAGYGMCYRKRGFLIEAVEKRLLDLLFFLGPRRCQVPRDRVHSLLAIAEDADHLPVDYSMPEHLFISSLLLSYNQSMCLCSLARLADVLDCVEPFASSAPQSLFVQLSLMTSKPETRVTLVSEPLRMAPRYFTVCASCDRMILVDSVKEEHVFCLRRECFLTAEGHLIIPKDTKVSQSGTMSTIKLIRHEHWSLEDPVPRTRERPLKMLYFGLETKAADDFPSKLMEPPLYSIVLPFESLVDISLNVADDGRTLCQKARNSQGGFNFIEKDSLDLSRLN